MDNNKVDMFINTVNGKFESHDLMSVKEQLEKADENKYSRVQVVGYKNPTTMIIIAFFLGGLGIDRFMLGQVGLGVLKILTIGGLGVWAIIDVFTASARTKRYNYNQFVNAVR